MASSETHQIPSAPCRLCGGETFIAFSVLVENPTVTETCAACGHQVFYSKHPLAGAWTLEQAMNAGKQGPISGGS